MIVYIATAAFLLLNLSGRSVWIETQGVSTGRLVRGEASGWPRMYRAVLVEDGRIFERFFSWLDVGCNIVVAAALTVAAVGFVRLLRSRHYWAGLAVLVVLGVCCVIAWYKVREKDPYVIVAQQNAQDTLLIEQVYVVLRGRIRWWTSANYEYICTRSSQAEEARILLSKSSLGSKLDVYVQPRLLDDEVRVHGKKDAAVAAPVPPRPATGGEPKGVKDEKRE
jgi:hypothetical protein